MIAKPPPKRRPQAVPTRDAPPADKPAGAGTPSEKTESAEWLARTQAAKSLSERRRVRRLKQAADSNVLPPSAVPAGQPTRIFISMRWFSAGIVLALLVVLFLFSRDIFFISEIYVGGTHYLTPPDIFERSGLANMHLFWVDPVAIEARLKLDPEIADANVVVGWPPNMVQISITEREPTIIWQQAGQRVWLDVTGHVMYMRQDLPDLPEVVVEKPSATIHIGPCPLQGMGEPLGPGSCIDPNIVSGALQFKALYPNVKTMVYDPYRGLGFHEGGGWVLWFGNGADISTKMSVYNAVVKQAIAEGKHLVEVDVSNPDAPVISLAPQ